jgi:hypothetical protein
VNALAIVCRVFHSSPLALIMLKALPSTTESPCPILHLPLGARGGGLSVRERSCSPRALDSRLRTARPLGPATLEARR